MAFTSISARLAQWLTRLRLWFSCIYQKRCALTRYLGHWCQVFRLRFSWPSLHGSNKLQGLSSRLYAGIAKIGEKSHPFSCLLQRVSRVVCAFLSLAILACGVFIGALYFFVTPDSACRLLSDFSQKTLSADAKVEGPVQITLLPRLSVKFPRIQFKNLSDGMPCGSVEATSLDVSLWSLPLGVVRIQRAHLKAPETTFNLDAFQALPQGATQLTFPRWLLVKSVAISDATLHLRAAQKELCLEHLSLELGQFSPEMKTHAELKSQFSTHAARFGTLTGQVTLSTNLAFSASSHNLAFSELRVSGSAATQATPFAMQARAESLSLCQTLAHGKAIQVNFYPEKARTTPLCFGFGDFLLEKNKFTSPDLQFSYTRESSDIARSFSISSALTLDLSTLRGQLKNILGTLSASRLPTSSNANPDILMRVSGTADIDLGNATSDIRLAGILANAPFTYDGQWTGLDHSKITGTLQFESFDLNQFPLQLSDIGNTAAETILRIQRFHAFGLQARHLVGKLSLSPSSLRITDAQAEFADGLIQGTGQIASDGRWNLDAHLENIDFTKAQSLSLKQFLFSGQMSSGQTSGSLQLSGTGKEFSELKGAGKLRITRGTLRGPSLEDLQEFASCELTEDTFKGNSDELAFDELTYDLTLQGSTAHLENLSAKSSQWQLKAALEAENGQHGIKGEGTLTLLSAGTPLKTTISGTWSKPVWHLVCDERPKGQPTSLTQRVTSKARSLWRHLKRSLEP